MLPFSLEYNHVAMESLIFRTMHSSVLHALLWVRGATSDHETSDVKTCDVETGDAETSDRGSRENKLSL